MDYATYLYEYLFNHTRKERNQINATMQLSNSTNFESVNILIEKKMSTF